MSLEHLNAKKVAYFSQILHLKLLNSSTHKDIVIYINVIDHNPCITLMNIELMISTNPTILNAHKVINNPTTSCFVACFNLYNAY